MLSAVRDNYVYVIVDEKLRGAVAVGPAPLRTFANYVKEHCADCCVIYTPSLVGLTASVSPLTPNDPYRDRPAPLTSKRCILYIYSTNISTEYFKHGIYSPFFLFKMQFVS